MNEFEDKDLVCICGELFVWTAGEQNFINDLYLKKKIPSVQTPKRCQPCREKKRKEREKQEHPERY